MLSNMFDELIDVDDLVTSLLQKLRRGKMEDGTRQKSGTGGRVFYQWDGCLGGGTYRRDINSPPARQESHEEPL